jgi:hypothetical protein
MSYSPVLGRFIKRDPLRYVDGGSLYQYVGGRCNRLLDPRGLWSSDVRQDAGVQGALPVCMPGRRRDFLRRSGD